MTNSKLTDDLLNEYLDGNLSEVERQAVAAAVAQSPEAQARLAEYQTLFATFADVRDLPLTTDLTPAFLTAVQQTAVHHPPTPPWLRLLPVMQIGIATILVILFWPVLQSGWAYGRTLLPTSLPPLVLPNVHEIMTGWLTAVPPLTLPTLQLNLPVYQWAILIILTLIIWLFGARLLFSDPARAWNRGD